MPIDMSAAVAPPRKRTPSTSTRKSATITPVETESRQSRREKGLNGIAQMAQGGLALFGQFADAATIGRYFPDISHELSKIAEENETIAKPIDVIISVGPYGALIAAVLPFAMQVAANHGLVNAQMFGGQGVVPPEMLDAEYKTQLMRMQMEMMKAQQKAVEEAKAAQREMEDLLSKVG